MIRLGLIVDQTSHLELLQNAFQADFEFQIMELTRPSAPDVLVIDLADQPVRQPQFWITLHSLYPAVALMGVLETPLDLTVLQAALQAGAQYLVAWTDPPHRWRAVARMAFHREVCDFQGEIREASWALMDDWAPSEASDLHIGALQVDLSLGQATVGHGRLDLSPLEFKVLAYLMRHAGHLVSPAELLRNVWQDSEGSLAGYEQVRSCLKRLRRKLGEESPVPPYIVAVRGQGWRMRTDVEWRGLAHTVHQPS